MTHLEWLAQLRTGDLVEVFFGSNSTGIEEVTSAPKTMVTIGKHRNKASFRRSDGRMAGGGPMARWFRIERP